MSCIICLASDSFAFIAGDGRAINSETGEVVDENYKKVRRINENVIVGFVGCVEICEGALDALPNDTEHLTLSEISEILCRNAKKLHHETNLKGSMILAGIENGKIVVCSFSRLNGYVIERTEYTSGSLTLEGRYPDNIESNIFAECYEECSDKGLSYLVKETFRRVSALSDTVNENISLLCVEIPS